MKTLVTLFRENVWFFLPFLLWLVAGGVMQGIFFTHEELFLGINRAHAPWADVLMTGLTYIGDGTTFAAMLLVLLAMRKFRLFFTGLCTLLLVTLIVQAVKHYFNAPRPLNYFGDTCTTVHLVEWVTVHGSCSFPSGHSSTAFAMFCLLSLISKNKTWGALFIVLALTAGYSRIYLAQHFFSDVYIGSIIGTAVSLLVYTMFKQKKAKAAPELCPEAVSMLPKTNL